MTLQEQQAPIDRRLVSALIEATPETWNAAALHVVRTDDGQNEKMQIEISSPEGFSDLIDATEEIYEALYALSDCFRVHGKMWSELKYVAELSPDGDWKFEASFTY